MKYYAKRYGETLVPTTRDTAERVKKIPGGDIVEITIKASRNRRHNSKYWAILGEVAHNTDFRTADEVHEWIKIELGLFDIRTIQLKDRVHTFPQTHSTSFAKMNQTAFAEFYERAMDVIVVNLGFDLATLEKEI